MAPEMFMEKPYDYKADMWACGVILHNLLSGSYPWDADDEKELATLICKAEVCVEDDKTCI